jgi:hypothetical protein
MIKTLISRVKDELLKVIHGLFTVSGSPVVHKEKRPSIARLRGMGEGDTMSSVVRAIPNTFRLLLVVLLCVSVSSQLSVVLGSPVSTLAAPKCKCCKTENLTCGAACCAAPVRSTSPIVPASTSVRSSNQWLAVAVSSLVLPVSASVELSGPSAAVASFLPMRSIPLFQRDCSYLL